MDLEKSVLSHLNEHQVIEESRSFAATLGVGDYEELANVIKRLVTLDIAATEVLSRSDFVLTPMARAFASASPERQVYQLIPPEGISQADLKNIPLVKETDGFPIAMSNKWLKTEKMEGGVKVVRAMDESAVMSAPDPIASAITALLEGKSVDDATASILKKRKFAEVKVTKSFRVSKGKNFVLERKPMVTDLSPEMLQTGSWKNLEFKPYNFKTLGRIEEGGHLHPLLKVRSAYRQVFLEMGFSEMPTNNFVESSFWNFDALFQPQQHPARDSHDTFFLENPPPLAAPRDYIEKVREMHSKGDADSIGWRYDWSEAEATKTLLRTHTTAVSSRMLYQLAQEKFAPRRYFSIDRVFRNEQPDATHLAEFHQIEGVVCDVGLSLADLMGVVQEFFKRIGLDGLKFKPAYNPYTEPSMEIFAFHKGLSKWVEVGNSGIFRPEMLRPMGLPDNVSVIAWGISLERPTMIRYGIDNIRDLVGHKVDLNLVRETPVFSLSLPKI